MDDGDGKHVLPITVRLPLVNMTPPPPTPTPRQTQIQTQDQSQGKATHFIPAKERKALRKLAFLESQSQAQSQDLSKGKGKGKETEKVKGYMRNDVRVGDTCKVRGRVDEYRRGGEWVRVVVVELGSGGSVGMSSSSSLSLS